MTTDGKNLTVKQVVSRVEMVRKMQKSGDPKFREYSEVIYDDHVWTITLEVHPYGTIRFWVAREDAYGHYNNTTVPMYISPDNGQLRYSADFEIKKSVIDRLKRIYLALVKAGLEE